MTDFMNTKIVKINREFSLEVMFYSAGGAGCDLRFCNGGGYYSVKEEVDIDVQKAKELISALARFVNAVESLSAAAN
jgi:hypothetical protein